MRRRRDCWATARVDPTNCLHKTENESAYFSDGKTGKDSVLQRFISGIKHF